MLAELDGLELRHAPDGWHGLWSVNGITHQIWLPEGRPDATSCYAAILPLDAFLELRAHAARRFWRSLAGRPPGPPPDVLPDQRRHWHILSLRALDARLTGESHRGIAASLLGFRGRKEDFEIDPCRNRTRRLIAHGVRMMHGDYRYLLHYPVRPNRR